MADCCVANFLLGDFSLTDFLASFVSPMNIVVYN